MRIVEAGRRHAEPGRRVIHGRHEGGLRAAHRLGDRNGDVVGRFRHEETQRRLQGQRGADGEAHPARWLLVRLKRDLHRRSEREGALAHRFEGDVHRHQLGDGGGVPRPRRLVLCDHLAGRDVEQHERPDFRPRRRGERTGEGERGEKGERDRA